MSQIQTRHWALARPYRRWAVWCWIVSAAVLFTACGLFGGDESGSAGPDAAAPTAVEAGEEADEEEGPQSPVDVPLETQAGEDGSELFDRQDGADVGEPLQGIAVAEDGGGGTGSDCWWETAEGADVFSEYLMANVVCAIPGFASPSWDDVLDTVPAGLDPAEGPGVTGGTDPAGAIAPNPDATPEISGLLAPGPGARRARFGWRCSVGAKGEDLDDGYYLFEHSGRLEVFASNGGPPQTLQFESAQPFPPDEPAGLEQVPGFDLVSGLEQVPGFDLVSGLEQVPGFDLVSGLEQVPDLEPQVQFGSVAQTGGSGDPAREAAVLVRFGSDHHPLIPASEVIENQQIVYEGLWRNSANRPPRDRAGVLSVLEDRDYNGQYDDEELEMMQEHSRHAQHLLYAPDEVVESITAALVLDTSGRLHTAVAGIYLDFDISGWEEHVGPVLEACGFNTTPAELAVLRSSDEAPGGPAADITELEESDDAKPEESDIAALEESDDAAPEESDSAEPEESDGTEQEEPDSAEESEAEGADDEDSTTEPAPG